MKLGEYMLKLLGLYDQPILIDLEVRNLNIIDGLLPLM